MKAKEEAPFFSVRTIGLEDGFLSSNVGNGVTGLARALDAELEPLGGVPSLKSARDESRDELGTRSPPGLLELPCPVKSQGPSPPQMKPCALLPSKHLPHRRIAWALMISTASFRLYPFNASW
ncbi:hypothetical protein LEMLEM_LOCUS27097 [Lemmus lemmus]